MYEPREFDLKGVQGLSPRAIELHLGLYRGYVEQVNRHLGQIREKPGEAGKATYDARARSLAFEWNGMVLHEIFFDALRGPGRTLDEEGVFAEALDESFGGFDAWKKDLAAMAAVRGVGWVATVRDPETSSTFNVWLDEHQLGTPAGVQTLFVLDLWEHAWLLDYAPARKPEYVQTILANVDWSVIESRCPPAAEGPQRVERRA
jgi:Fe-Mn family superoxide dismutase